MIFAFMEPAEQEITTEDSDAILKYLFNQKRKVEYKVLLAKASAFIAPFEVGQENSMEYVEETLEACLTHLIEDFNVDSDDEDEPGFIEGVFQIFSGKVDHYWITPQGRRF